MKLIQIHKIQSGPGDQEDFKICSVQFDSPQKIDEPIRANKYNILWIKEGTGRYKIDFDTYEIESQMMFFLTPGQMYQIVSEQIVEGVRLAFDQDFYCVDTFGTQASCNGILFKNPYRMPYIQLNETQSDEFSRIIKRINQEFEEPGIAHEELIHTYLQLFLIFATRIKEGQSDAYSPGVKEESSKFLSDFNYLIENNFKEKHAVSDYADMLYLTPKSLHKKIKHLTGKSVSKIIQDRIILEAKRMLYHSDLNIKEIGYELGFDDASYFTRYFSKHADQAPTEFREHIK